MKCYKNVKEMKQGLKQITTAIAGTDRFIACSLPLLVEEVQLVRKRLDDILYYLSLSQEKIEKIEEVKRDETRTV